MKTEEDLQQRLQTDFKVQDEQFTSVQSTKKRRRKCVIVSLVMLVIVVIVAVMVPLVLLKDNQTSDTKPLSNSTIKTDTGEWSTWSICSVTCGNGTKERTRTCRNSEESSCNVTTERLPCQMSPCNESSNWGQWSQWSACSKTCATGIQSRNRSCTSKEGKEEKEGHCDGDKRETRECTLSECTRIDCSEWLRSGQRTNGIYKVDPDGRGSFSVFCDMTRDGGGWTVFQRRQDGSEDFYRTWDDYKTGFGNLSGEFWLGNEKLHRLTTSLNSSLGILIGDWSGGLHNASYLVFRVDGEESNYTLSVLSYSGNAGDSMTEHNGMMFTTKDRDNDKETASNCARGHHGGWWYNRCYRANLNGKYVGDKNDRQGVVWLTLTAPNFKSLKTTEMRLRPAV